MENENLLNEAEPVKPKRKRIPLVKPVSAGVPVKIEDEFKANMCVSRAKYICDITNSYKAKFWTAEHYHDRHRNGDVNGARKGIDPHIVHSLVERSLKYLFHYSAMFATFKLINFPGQTDRKTAAVVLQERQPDGSMLNVVVEVHHKDGFKYEITVKTAMCEERFNLWLGQYVIEIQGEEATLKRFDNGHLVTVH